MENFNDKQHFVGCDVSKETLDFALHVRGHRPSAFPHIRVANDKAGFRQMRAWLRANGVKPADAVVGMEHTGVYSEPLAAWLHGNKTTFVMLHPLDVKNFGGRHRAKTDKADSQVIADYVYTNREKLAPSAPEAPPLRALREKARSRAQLVKSRAALKNQLSTLETRTAIRALRKTIEAMTAAISSLDEDIRRHASALPELAKTYSLLTVIRGVGAVNAVNVIVATGNFTRFQTARQFAKHVCVAPLPCQSGTSVRHGDHVSRMGRSDLKSGLTMAARSSVEHDPEMRAYCERKLAQGKAYGVVLNAVKFKIICRMFAVVRRGTPYVPRDTYRQ